MKRFAGVLITVVLISFGAQAGSCEGLVDQRNSPMGEVQLFDALTQQQFGKYDANKTLLWCGALTPNGEPGLITTDSWDETTSLTVFVRKGDAFKPIGTINDVDNTFVVDPQKNRITIRVTHLDQDSGHITKICTYHVTPKGTLRTDGCLKVK